MLREPESNASEANETVHDGDELSSFDPVDFVLREFESDVEYYRTWHEQIPEEVEFVLDQVQYRDDMGHTLDDEDAQAKDTTLLNMARRKWSQIAASPTYINCYPVSQDGNDPLAAERTKWGLEHEVYNPAKMYRRKRRRAIIGCVVGRVWYLSAEWDSDLREVVYRTKAPIDVFPAPGWQDLHDPQCPYVKVRDEITVDEARNLARRYGQLTEEEILEIESDADAADSKGASKPSSRIPGMVNLRNMGEDGPGSSRRNTVQVLTSMYRGDPERAVLEEELDPEDLSSDEQFMRCWTCEYETKDHPTQEDGSFPDTGEPCPNCAAKVQSEGGDPDTAPKMEAVRQLQPWRTEIKYPRGRWIVVLPNSRKCIYDGEWPYKKPNDQGTLRSFPLAQFRIYDDPRHAIPHSDVSWQWNQQALATYMLQWAVDQMRTSGRVIFLPYRGIVDERGRAWQMSNRIDQIAFVKDPMMANAVKDFQPRGLPDSWGLLYSQLVSGFKSNLGTGELGLGPEQSKNLPVGTVHAIMESGDIPTDDATGMIRDEEGLFLGVVADMLQCCWDRNRWVRYLGQDGQQAYEYFSGADLTAVDVMITGDPGFDVLQSAKLDRMAAWFKMTPPQRKLAGELLNLEPSRMAKFEQDEQQFAQSQSPPPPPPEKVLSAIGAALTGIANVYKIAPGLVTQDQVEQILSIGGIHPPGIPGAGGPAGPGVATSGMPGLHALLAAHGAGGPMSGETPQDQNVKPAPGTDLQMGGVHSLSPMLQKGLSAMVAG